MFPPASIEPLQFFMRLCADDAVNLTCASRIGVMNHNGDEVESDLHIDFHRVGLLPAELDGSESVLGCIMGCAAMSNENHRWSVGHEFESGNNRECRIAAGLGKTLTPAAGKGSKRCSSVQWTDRR